MFVKKHITPHEYETAHLASQHHIGPKIISYDKYNKVMVMEPLEMTLDEVDPDEIDLYDTDIPNKIQDLHDLHLFHGDLHPGNIMINYGKVYLIDFDQTVHFDEIDPTYIAKYAHKWDADLQTLNQLLEHEKTLWASL